MTNEERARIRRILPVCAAVTAVVCIIILFFFRTSVFAEAIGTLLSITEPFIFGIAIAYILRPMCLTFEGAFGFVNKKLLKKELPGLQRMAGILLAIIILLAGITLVLVSVVPELITSITGLVSQIPPAIESFQEWLAGLDKSKLSHDLVEAVTEAADAVSDWMQNFLKKDLLPTLQSVLPDVTSGFMGVLDVIKNFGLGCIIAAYILGSWERSLYQGRLTIYALLPKPAAEYIRKELHYANGMFSGFINGKILDSLIMGVICFIFMSITRMPFIVLVSVLIGVTNFIPFFGQFLGTIPATLMILIESPSAAFVFLIFMVILQQVDGNFIGPRILGGRMGISGFWILFSILFFGGLMGPVGMLIGVPLFAVIYDMLKNFLFGRLKKKGKARMIEEYERTYHPEEFLKKDAEPVKQENAGEEADK